MDKKKISLHLVINLFPGSLSTASLCCWEKDPGCGWSREKYVGREGWQSILVVAVTYFVGL